MKGAHADGLEAGGEGDRGQLHAFRKGELPDCGHALGQHQRAQAGDAEKGGIGNGGYGFALAAVRIGGHLGGDGDVVRGGGALVAGDFHRGAVDRGEVEHALAHGVRVNHNIFLYIVLQVVLPGVLPIVRAGGQRGGGQQGKQKDKQFFHHGESDSFLSNLRRQIPPFQSTLNIIS